MNWNSIEFVVVLSALILAAIWGLSRLYIWIQGSEPFISGALPPVRSRSFSESLLPKPRPIPCPSMKPPRPEIVCLCGSTRFMDAFHAAGWVLTLQGKIVLTVGVCKHAEHHGAEALGQDVVEQLDELHFRKIDLSDWVFVLNVGGYIGDSTANEIEYAADIDKPVYYLDTGHTPDNPEMKQLIETVTAAMEAKQWITK